MIDEYATHGLRGHRIEMGPILPSHTFVINESKINLIDQSRCLHCMARTLATHVMMGQPAQLFIDEGNQPIQCCLVPIAPLYEQLGYGFLRGCHSATPKLGGRPKAR